MSELFPKAPFIPATGLDTRPACAWVLPAPAVRRDSYAICKALPPGMPDCLEVSIGQTPEGTERTTAAIYGQHAYLIHYEFNPAMPFGSGKKETAQQP